MRCSLLTSSRPARSYSYGSDRSSREGASLLLQAFSSLYKMFVYWLEQVTWPTLGKGIMSHAAKGMETGSRKNGGH